MSASAADHPPGAASFRLVTAESHTIRNVVADPSPETLVLRIRQELASLDRAAQPPEPERQEFDGVFDRKQWDLIHAMTLPLSR